MIAGDGVLGDADIAGEGVVVGDVAGEVIVVDGVVVK